MYRTFEVTLAVFKKNFKKVSVHLIKRILQNNQPILKIKKIYTLPTLEYTSKIAVNEHNLYLSQDGGGCSCTGK